MPVQLRKGLRFADGDLGGEAALSLPVLDRFLNLMLSLHKPDFYKGIKFSEQEFAT